MHATLEQLHASYAQALQGRSAMSLEAHPANDPHRWNTRQIVEHLVLTYQLSSEVFRERLAKGRPTEATPRAYQRVQQLFVCRFGYFPTGRTAPPKVFPSSAGVPLDGESWSDHLKVALQAMDELLVTCKQQFGDKKFASHQVLGPISADQWRRFHVVHGLHHLKQLRQLNAK